MIRGGRPDALRVRCPWCHAEPERWCEKIVTVRRGKDAVPSFVHPSRIDLARHTR